MTFEEILDRFESSSRSGKGFKARCPAHEDKVSSLSINEADGGKILLKCHAGCSTKAVIDAVGLTWRDLAGNNGSPRQSQKEPVTARYVYTDENNKPLFRVCRTRTKDFFQERFEAGKFIAGMNGARRVLYRLPEVTGAENVFICEGEKDADKLISLGLVATTNPGGAGKWSDAYTESLRGKSVVIFPDNDEPGKEHALRVARSVLPVAKSVKIVSLPDLPPKGDVSDYLESHDKAELLALVELAPTFTGDADSKGQRNLFPRLLTAKEILEAPKDPTRWILDECLPVGGASIFVAKPKDGKTTTAVDLSVSVMRGEPFLGRKTQQSPVAYFYFDTGGLADISDTFTKAGLRESDPIVLHAGGVPPTNAVEWILETVKVRSTKLVIIDTIQKFFRFENIGDYAEINNKTGPLFDVARDAGCHVMFLHHAKLNVPNDLDAALGSTAFRGLCYTYLYLRRLGNGARRIISSDQRGGKNFEQLGIGFDKQTGRLKVEGTLFEIEIEETMPKITEYLANLDPEAEDAAKANSTRWILEAVKPVKRLIASMALAKLFKENKVERTGEGRKGSPYRYSVTASIFDEESATSPSSATFGSYSSSYTYAKKLPKGSPARELNPKVLKKVRKTKGQSRSRKFRNRMGTNWELKRNRMEQKKRWEPNPKRLKSSPTDGRFSSREVRNLLD